MYEDAVHIHQPRIDFAVPHYAHTRRWVGGEVARESARAQLIVPKAKAEAVRPAVAQWLEAQGVSAGLTAEDAGNDRSRIRATLDEAQSAHIDLSADSVQPELGTVLAAAMR
jgi:hypothetical protein